MNQYEKDRGSDGLLETPEALARQFHEAYERLAPAFGYETRKESAKPWDEVPENNRRLMTAVCAEVGGRLRGIRRSVFCSYCGQETDLEGKGRDERNALLLEHISVCPKRPETKLLGVALAAEAAHEAFLGVLDIDGGENLGKAMAHLRVQLDKLKVANAT
jgi:hypothetical protein